MRVEAVDALGRYDAVYLSPHLDDVALSCPGAVLADERALVVTAFSEGEAADPDSVAHYAMRQDEDARAMALLGADHLYLGLRDAPVRSPTYQGARGILLGWDPADEATITRLAAMLEAVLARTGGALVAPLGVGGHVDHRIAFAAARRAGASRYYEDRPYALVPVAVALRLAAIGWGPPVGLGRARHLWALQRAPYARAWVGFGTRLRLCASRSARATRPATPHVRPFERRLPQICAVAGAYRSQLPYLYGDLDGFAAMTRAGAVALGHAEHAERTWAQELSGLPSSPSTL